MSFNDENIEMVTSETIRLTNAGNAVAKFNWLSANTLKIFTIKPEDGVV